MVEYWKENQLLLNEWIQLKGWKEYYFGLSQEILELVTSGRDRSFKGGERGLSARTCLGIGIQAFSCVLLDSQKTNY